MVNWSDEIAQQTHDLEDGLPLTEEQAIEELAIARQVRAARGWGSDPASRRASLIRGMIGVLCSDLVEGSRARIERWLERERVDDVGRVLRPARPPPGGSRRLHGGGQEALRASCAQFVYRHIIHSFPVSRHDGHARRVLAGIFAAYRDNPRLLPDDVLHGLARELGAPFLREIPLAQIEREVDGAIPPQPAFYRTIADHIAGMTDSYCNSEYRQLVLE